METNEIETDKKVFEEKYGFKPQKTIACNKILPYNSYINDEAVTILKEIKENISKAVILRDITPSCVHWLSKLSKYITLYGFCFSKEDHVLFVKLCYTLVTVENQEFWVTKIFCRILQILLKKKELLTPDDLVLEWKPIADAYLRLFNSAGRRYRIIRLPDNAESIFKNVIKLCNPYFNVEATSEILELLRPQFCPSDMSMTKAVSMAEVFLPTRLPHNMSQHGYKLWLDEFNQLWTSHYNESYWASTMFRLFARLAWQNIGYISWEEHLPLIFTKVLWQFQLPVAYKNRKVAKNEGPDNYYITMFIVANLGGGSSTQKHLDHMFKVLESYCHPSNHGAYQTTLIEFQVRLTQLFVNRINNERYKKPSWTVNIPEEKKLTEDDITAFVNCLKPSAALTAFAKSGSYRASIVLNRLAFLRPQIIIPPLIEDLYYALENTTEPHRLITALNCMLKVARPFVSGGKKSWNDTPTYPEGPVHVIPLLFHILPGIDPNDLTKCMITMQFIDTIVALIPLQDCSSAIEEIEDLTEIEQQICQQTSQLEDFILEYMSRCFVLIENSSLIHSTSDSEKKNLNLEENFIKLGLSSPFKTVLMQSHPALFDVALERLVNFIKGRCMETKVAGKLMAAMCRSAAKVDSEKTLKALLPNVCRTILSLTEYEESLEDENLDEKLIFNMQILAELVQAKSIVLVHYVPKISEVLERTLHLKSTKGYKMATQILRNLLWSLNQTVVKDTKSCNFQWDTPMKEFLSIRHWGEAGDIDNLGLEWIEPSEPQKEQITFLIHKFLIPELDLLKKIMEGDSSFSRDRFHQSLMILKAILAAGGSLPMWDEKPWELSDLCVDRNHSHVRVRLNPIEVSLSHPSYPSNVRLAIAQTIVGLVDHLLNKESDDVIAFKYTMTIMSELFSLHGVVKENYGTRVKTFEHYKEAMSDSVMRKKQNLRSIILKRTLLQYDARILEGNSLPFTNTHHEIFQRIYDLSTSLYSEVRKKGQSILQNIFNQYPFSYKLIIDRLVVTLGKDPEKHHKAVKGALYVINGSNGKSLIRCDWNSLNRLIPPLVSAEHSEKTSIVKLYKSIMLSFVAIFDTFAIEINVPNEAVNAAKNLLASPLPAVANNTVDACKDLETVEKIKLRSEYNLKEYSTLIDNLVTIFESGKLTWRRSGFCLTVLATLVRFDVPFPAQAVQVLLNNALNDNIILRKTCINSMSIILRNQKRPTKKRTINPSKVGVVEGNDNRPGDSRPDNRWMQYNPDSINLSESDWENNIFLHKTFNGWYSWPKEIKVYAPPSEQPPINREYSDLSEAEKVFYDFFTDEHKVDKLIGFLSLEENKGSDKFATRKYSFFKGLFRNFGDSFLDILEKHLWKLVGESQESHQRCASEIISGLMRGSKNWPFKQAQRALQLTCELFEVVFSKVMNETLHDWGSCLMHITMDRDPNRMAPLVELLTENPIRQEQGSFLVSRRLYMCQVFLEQQEWRVSNCCHRILKDFEPHLSNPYKIIRDRIGIWLYKIFMREEGYAACGPTLYPSQEKFVEEILPQLSILIQESGSNGGSGGEPIVTSSHNGSFHSITSKHSAMETTSAITVQAVLASSSTKGTLWDDDCNNSPNPMDAVKILKQNVLEPSAVEEQMEIGEPIYSTDVKGSPISLAIPGSGFEPGESEERKKALRLMATMCKFVFYKSSNVCTYLSLNIFKFLPHLCQLESIDTDADLSYNCLASLASLSHVLLYPHQIMPVLEIVESICQGGFWRARIAAVTFLQVMVFNNMFTIIEGNHSNYIKQIVIKCLEDKSPEVRSMASTVLSGLFHCKLIDPKDLLKTFTKKLNKVKRKRDKSYGRLMPFTAENIIEKHTAALGMLAYIKAFPYDVPDLMPDILITLSEHINDSQPIANAIKLGLRDFKRTHYDNWKDHKKKFTSDQLVILNDVLVSPSYYA